MKNWDHGYVVGGRDEQGPFLLGSYRTKQEAIKSFENAMSSESWVARYRDTLYMAQLVEQRIEG